MKSTDLVNDAFKRNKKAKQMTSVDYKNIHQRAAQVLKSLAHNLVYKYSLEGQLCLQVV